MLKAFLALLLPPVCPICSEAAQEGRFCKKCIDDIRMIKSPMCPSCGTPFISRECEDHLCGICIKKKMPFSMARSVGIYEGILMEAIHRFKYNGKTSMAKPLAGMMADALETRLDKSCFDLIVAVPLHRARLRERRFNQSLLMAKEIARICNMPVDYLNLKRTCATEPQVNLKGKERLKNVRNAFSAADKGVFKGKRILLIDDVYTTGATIMECSRVLKRAGAESIFVFTLARVVNL